MMMNIDMNVPRLVLVRDYHEFNDLESTLRKLNRSLRCTEVGFDGSEYVGVIYFGRKPSKDELRELAAKQRIVLTDVEDMA